jgi:hypothetical protein
MGQATRSGSSSQSTEMEVPVEVSSPGPSPLTLADSLAQLTREVEEALRQASARGLLDNARRHQFMAVLAEVRARLAGFTNMN